MVFLPGYVATYKKVEGIDPSAFFYILYTSIRQQPMRLEIGKNLGFEGVYMDSKP